MCPRFTGGTNGALRRGKASGFPNVRSQSVTSLPLVTQAEPLGIVIKSGAPKPKPARFWAYLWAADDENTVELHWHQRVPAEHAA